MNNQGVKKGQHFTIKDKLLICITCGKKFIARGRAKYCWDCKKID